MANTCGSCTVCCTAMEVKELRKPAGLRCLYLTNEGCSIYENRPQSCREYECAFRMYPLDKKLRPDRSGFQILFSKTKLGDTILFFYHGKVNKLARKLFDRLIKKGPLRNMPVIQRPMKFKDQI